MNNIYILNKNYKKIGTLSNQGANPQAPYYEDLFIQELETGADTYQFSTMSTPYTQDLLEIGNHIMFTYKNRNELFTITSLEYSHNEGYKTIGVYAEGIGFDLLEVYMKRPENEKESSSGGSSSGGSSSGSGGSSSGGGMDNDNDGDDNTDDEYADVDDVYVDENGIIIYDKYGQDDYADPDNVSVDENGIIIYRRNKRNRKKDSLEFKNISYSRFLSILLKNTGWSYVCQPGLESIKHDITVRYDTNIFALLQDSMQSYRGVELEFVHELVGGRVQKVIKAYKDGGRGSFVGKRFEYGTNVRGITKTQEVANSEDDTILYIDNVGINVQYDVDFALKSAEVPEIEIGDTHYVIDRDFYPPMTIKARIGKIEISFSDPTVNKIYLANNKRISGSAIEEELDEDDIADIIDDYDIGDGGYDEYVPDHDHYNLLSHIGHEDGSITTYGVSLSEYQFLPYSSNYYDLGSETCPWDFAYTNHIKNNNSVQSLRYFGYNYQVRYDREDMENVKKITNSSTITKQDLLNFVMNDLNVYEYSSTEVDKVVNKGVDDPDAYFPDQIYFGLLSEDVVSLGSDGEYRTSKVGARITRGMVTGDTNNDGDKNVNDATTHNTYNISAVLSCLIGAFQQHVLTGGGATTSDPSPKDQYAGYEDGGGYSDPEDPDYPDYPDNPSNPGSGSYGKITCNELEVSGADGSAGIANIFGELYVTEGIRCELTTETNTLEVNTIIFSDGTTMTTANGSGGSTPSNPGTGGDAVFDHITANGIHVEYLCASTFTLTTGENYPALFTVYGTIISDILSTRELEVDTIKFSDGTTMTTANGSGGGSGNTFDTIRVDYIWCANEDTGAIHMQDDLILHNSLQLHGDLEVEDGIVYANEVRALKFTDLSGNPINSVSALSDLSEYATVEALQEEIRAKDEQIASLEARLAKIEAMLDINNDN